MGFHKLPWRTVNQRDYKHFDNENFTQDICKFNFSTSKSSCLRKFFEIAVLKNFAIFTGKHSFYKKRLQHKCFPVNIAKFLRIVFYRTPPVAASVLLIRNVSKLQSSLLLINTPLLSIRAYETPLRKQGITQSHLERSELGNYYES